MQSQVGVPGVRRSGGGPRAAQWIIEAQLSELRGYRGNEIYTEMAFDPIGSALATAISSMIAGLEWEVQNDPDDFISSVLNDMGQPWVSFIQSVAWGMVVYGHNVQEVVFKKRDGYKASSQWRSSAYTDGRLGIFMIDPGPRTNQGGTSPTRARSWASGSSRSTRRSSTSR